MNNQAARTTINAGFPGRGTLTLYPFSSSSRSVAARLVGLLSTTSTVIAAGSKPACIARFSPGRAGGPASCAELPNVRAESERHAGRVVSFNRALKNAAAGLGALLGPSAHVLR